MDFADFKDDVADAEAEGPPRQVWVATPNNAGGYTSFPVGEIELNDEGDLVIYADKP